MQSDSPRQCLSPDPPLCHEAIRHFPAVFLIQKSKCFRKLHLSVAIIVVEHGLATCICGIYEELAVFIQQPLQRWACAVKLQSQKDRSPQIHWRASILAVQQDKRVTVEQHPLIQKHGLVKTHPSLLYSGIVPSAL